MKQSFISRTNYLFQCARTSTIGARTSTIGARKSTIGARKNISQNTFQKLSDAKILKCSNEHMPRPPNKCFEAHCLTKHSMLERAPVCSNEQVV